MIQLMKRTLEICKNQKKRLRSDEIDNLDVSQDGLNFKCAHCSRSYTRRDTLNHHITRKHYNVGKYKCNKCDKSFSTTQELDNHLNSGLQHPVEPSLKCDVCTAVFNNTRTLRNHKATKHSEKKHICVRCNEKFAFKCLLNRHACWKRAKKQKSEDVLVSNPVDQSVDQSIDEPVHQPVLNLHIEQSEVPYI